MFSQDNYLKILDYATSAYKKENSKDIKEYLVHINALAMEIIHSCNNSSLDEKNSNLAISCALLSNILNNTEITYDDLYVQLSAEIADGVEALSQTDVKKSIEMLLTQPYEIQMVKLASLIVIISTKFKDYSDEKKSAYLKEASLILSCLKNSNIYLSNRLEEKIKEYKEI